jgi:hypothetical protein
MRGPLASTRIMPIENLLPGGLPFPLPVETATLLVPPKRRFRTLKRITGHMLLATLTVLAIALWKLPLRLLPPSAAAKAAGLNARSAARTAAAPNIEARSEREPRESATTSDRGTRDEVAAPKVDSRSQGEPHESATIAAVRTSDEAAAPENDARNERRPRDSATNALRGRALTVAVPNADTEIQGSAAEVPTEGAVRDVLNDEGSARERAAKAAEPRAEARSEAAEHSAASTGRPSHLLAAAGAHGVGARVKGASLQRQAVELVIAGDFVGAEQAYRTLASEYPDTHAFHEAARILATRRGQ